MGGDFLSASKNLRNADYQLCFNIQEKGDDLMFDYWNIQGNIEKARIHIKRTYPYALRKTEKTRQCGKCKDSFESESIHKIDYGRSFAYRCDACYEKYLENRRR